jgi:Mad3/BUB1 homology region 1
MHLFFYRYFSWVRSTFPNGGIESGMLGMLERATQSFLDDKRFYSNIEYLKWWVTFADLVPQRKLEIFMFLYKKGIARDLALFYMAWACVLEHEECFSQADYVYQLGVWNHSQPFDRLCIRHFEFQKRMYRKFLSAAKSLSLNGEYRNFIQNLPEKLLEHMDFNSLVDFTLFTKKRNEEMDLLMKSNPLQPKIGAKSSNQFTSTQIHGMNSTSALHQTSVIAAPVHAPAPAPVSVQAPAPVSIPHISKNPASTNQSLSFEETRAMVYLSARPSLAEKIAQISSKTVFSNPRQIAGNPSSTGVHTGRPTSSTNATNTNDFFIHNDSVLMMEEDDVVDDRKGSYNKNAPVPVPNPMLSHSMRAEHPFPNVAPKQNSSNHGSTRIVLGERAISTVAPKNNENLPPSMPVLSSSSFSAPFTAPLPQQQQQQIPQVVSEQSFTIFADESLVNEDDRDDEPQFQSMQGMQHVQQQQPQTSHQQMNIPNAVTTTFISAGSTNTSLGSTLPSTLYGHSNSSSATARYSDISRLVGSLEETNLPMNASGYMTAPGASSSANGFAPPNPDDSGMSVGLAHLSMHQSIRRNNNNNNNNQPTHHDQHQSSFNAHAGSSSSRFSNQQQQFDHSYNRDSLLGARLSLIAPLTSPSSSSAPSSSGAQYSHHFQLDRIMEEPEEGNYNNSGDKENSGDRMKSVSNSNNNNVLLQTRRGADNMLVEEEEEQSRSPQRSFIQYREPRGNLGATSGALNPSKRAQAVSAPAPEPPQANESFGICMDESLVAEEQENPSRAPYESPSKVPYPRVNQVLMQQQQQQQQHLHGSTHQGPQMAPAEYDRLPPDARRLSMGIKKHRASLMTKHRPNQNMQ